MQLTRAADYAVRVMIHLATAPAGSRQSRESLAEAADVPAQFMGKVLQALTRVQLITSHRGSLGGYALARPAESITMLEVIEAIEGPMTLNVCLTGPDVCGRSWWCAAHVVWHEAQQALIGVLQAANIADLAARSLARRRGEADAIVSGGPAWN